MAQATASADLGLDDERQAEFNRRLWRAVAISLALHVGVLAMVAWVRLPRHGERPLASIEISLASAPAPAPAPVVKAAAPPKSQPKAVSPPAPAPPVKPAPIPEQPAPVKPPPDVMKSIDVPPPAPKFGDFSPVETPIKKQFKLPDVPVVSETKDPVQKVPDVKSQPSLSEDVNKELEEELKKIKKVEFSKAQPSEMPPKPVPQIEAKEASLKAIDTALKVPGMAPGSNAYLGRVRQRISSYWSAPPVDVTGQSYVVIVQFRLHRNGSVTGVAIERSSGNEYYDLAGKRAVLSAVPLPAFPSDMTEPYVDAHFTFTVGDSQG